MSKKVNLKFVNFENGVSDPRVTPFTIIGQLDHLKKLGWSNVKGRLESRVTEEHYNSCLESLHPSPTDSCPLYMNYANIVALPTKVSRHNTDTRAHSLTKILKPFINSTSNEVFLLTCLRRNVLGSVAGISRGFPLFNMKSGGEGEVTDVKVELHLVDGLNLSESELVCVDDVSFAVRRAGRIVDMPCNLMNVDRFLEECLEVSRSLVGVKCEIIKGQDCEAKGLGGIWNVGKGGRGEGPALVVLTYRPPVESQKNIAWVGKGIVFDTGGLSIKSKTGMCGMKMDCGGAAGVLYAFYVAVREGFKDNLHAVLCVAENCVSENAMRPDDIITLYSGKTVEVNNTDAEGRLVLGDGVSYAKRDLGCEIIVDMATLTGAQGIATGKYHAAVLTNDETYENKLLVAGRNSGDLTFPIPFAPEMHFTEFHSHIADMKNSVADRGNAQSSCAGLFIFSHIGFDFPGTWIHIDMASPVQINDRGTGYGVMLLNTLFGGHFNEKSMFFAIRPE